MSIWALETTRKMIVFRRLNLVICFNTRRAIITATINTRFAAQITWLASVYSIKVHITSTADLLALPSE